jgi:hypothetical protein
MEPKMGLKAVLFFVVIVGIVYAIFKIIEKKTGR